MSTDLGKNSIRRHRVPSVRCEPGVLLDSELVRILVLDDACDTLEHLENSLWIWPHEIATAGSIDEAVTMCAHLRPNAVIADAGFSGKKNPTTISSLREQLPGTAIIAIASNSERKTRAKLLEQGADACLLREDLRRPVLHDLLQRIQLTSGFVEPLTRLPLPEIPMPWKYSNIMGTLICDIAGVITDVNKCLADWLGYPHPDALRGKSVWRDILESQGDWPAWKIVAGDTDALLHQANAIRGRSGQLLRMKVEVFAVPGFPSLLQAVFIGQTEVALPALRSAAG